MFGWAHPQELRIAAFQALEKLEPEWALAFLPGAGSSGKTWRLLRSPLRLFRSLCVSGGTRACG